MTSCGAWRASVFWGGRTPDHGEAAGTSDALGDDAVTEHEDGDEANENVQDPSRRKSAGSLQRRDGEEATMRRERSLTVGVSRIAWIAWIRFRSMAGGEASIGQRGGCGTRREINGGGLVSDGGELVSARRGEGGWGGEGGGGYQPRAYATCHSVWREERCHQGIIRSHPLAIHESSSQSSGGHQAVIRRSIGGRQEVVRRSSGGVRRSLGVIEVSWE